MAKWPWQGCHGNLAIETLPWQSCHGKVAMARLPWQLCHGMFAMATLPWQVCHGNFAMANEVSIALTPKTIPSFGQLSFKFCPSLFDEPIDLRLLTTTQTKA